MKIHNFDHFAAETKKKFSLTHRGYSEDLTKTYRSEAELFERLAGIVSTFAREIPFDTFKHVPSLILQMDAGARTVSYLDTQVESEGVDISTAHNLFEQPRKYGTIGYDIEFVHEDHRIVSHQFAFLDNEKRFGFCLYTDYRFSDRSFCDFIGLLIKSLYGTTHCEGFHRDSGLPYIRDWYIFAHNSLAEGSYVDSSQEKMISRADKCWSGDVTLFKAEDVKKNGQSRTVKLHVVDPDTGKLQHGKKDNAVKLIYCDTMGYFQSSLEAAAKQCGLKKYSLLDESSFSTPQAYKAASDIEYKRIDRFAQENPERFFRYGMRDVHVTASIPVVLHGKMGPAEVNFCSRMAKYSEKHFAGWFKENYDGIKQSWHEVLGQVYRWGKNGRTETMSQQWMPSKMQESILDEWYQGGRNDCHCSGAVEGPITYYDCTSAYPFAIAALPHDYDFSRYTEYTRHSGADAAIEKLWDLGPFQPHALKLYIRFREGAIPMAPHSTDTGIIFPTEGDGRVMSWPEYWTAKELGIIEEAIIFRFYEFPALPTRLLPDYILSMIEKRDQDPLIYKNLLNFLYGKLAQGVRQLKPYSSVSCPALAAYTTAVTRAATGELANLNQYFAITTDGFISSVTDLRKGKLNKLLIARAAEIKRVWIKKEFVGDKAIFWKTRGYILYDSTKPVTAPNKDRFKQAKMGVQGETPADFISQIKEGVGCRKSWTTFNKLDDGEFFQILEKSFAVNPTFDWKFVVLPETLEEKEIEIDGVEITIPTFQTRPLRDLREYNLLRELSHRKCEFNLEVKGKKELSISDLSDLMATYSMNSHKVRHIVWEFRKRMVRAVDWPETSMSEPLYRSWKTKPLYKIKMTYGPIEEYRFMLKIETRHIKDLQRRREVLNQIIQEMESSLTPLPLRKVA